MPNSTSASDRPSREPRETRPAKEESRLWRTLGHGLLAVAGLAVALWIFLLTPLGLDTAAWLAERAINAGSGLTARIEDVSGVVPFSLRVGRFALSDKRGPWLLIGDATIDWSPAALFRGRVLVHEIAADVVRVRRAPDMPAGTNEPISAPWPPRFPSLPPILVDRLAVTRLILDKELAGQDAVISINGRLAESGRGAVGLTLDATRLDGDKPLAVRIAGAFNYADWRLAAKVSLTDARGGLLAAALAGSEGGPLDVSLTGDGPLSAWKGKLSATLARKEFLTADLGLAVPLEKNAEAGFTLQATATPPDGLLPAELARLTGPRPTADVAGRVGIVSGAIGLDRADITLAAGRIAAKGALAPEKDTLAATLRLDVPDAATLDPSLAGTLAATINAAGTLSRPRLTARITAKAFQAGPLSLAGADLTAEADPNGPLDGTFPGAGIRVTGTLSGLAGPEGSTLLGDELKLAVSADVDADGGLAAPKSSLTGRGGALTITDARWRDGRAAGKCALDMADVAGAASLIGLKLSGTLTATADAGIDDTGRGEAALTIRLDKLSGRDQADVSSLGLAALLGPSPTLTATAGFSTDGVRLSGLALDGRNIRVTGSGSYESKGETLAATARLKAPYLSVLAGALGEKCGGALDATVELSGPAASPRIAVKGNADRPVYGDWALVGLDIDGAASDVAGKANGELRLTARREGEAAAIKTAFVLNGSQLGLKDLRLTAPQADFAADATIEMTTGRVAGRLSGNAANLAALGRFTGLPLAGGLKLSATAKTGGTGQALTCDLTASGLRAFGLGASSLAVSANLDDLYGRPRGKASASAKGLSVAGCLLDTASLTANGDGRAMLGLSASAKGRLPGGKPLELAAKAGVAPSGKGSRLTVTALSGSLDTHKFSLTAPAALTFGDGATRLAGLSLAFDKARLAASGSLDAKEATGKATVDHFPLAVLSVFGLGGIDGTGTLNATLGGSLSRPTLAADVRVDGLRLASEKGQGLRPLAIQATATVAGGACAVKGTLGASGKTAAATVDASLPLRFSLSPASFDLPEGGPLSGKITAASDLTDLATLLARINTRLVGRLTADLTLGGTLRAPSATGSVNLAASRLENADAGLVLRDVTVRVDAAGGRLTVTKGTGEDLKGGTFSLSGSLGISDPQNGPADLSLRLNHLRVAGLDVADVTADGTLAVTGTLSRMRAAGKIVLGPAAINLPSALPPDVVVIPVTLVNDPLAPKAPGKSATPPAAARHIDLDITVALGDSVYVRGMGLDSRWGGQIAITGTAAAPVIVGKYTVEKGRVELFGSNLEITKGEVSFHGQTPPVPTLDIRAETTTNDVTAGVAISGDGANPSITLTSTPSLPRDEILSRILFGQSAGTLSPLQAAQLAQAAASLYAGGTPTSILARTRRILGLDKLTLVSGKGSVSSTVLRAGKEIVKGVTVGVEQGMGAQSGAVSVEVQVTPNITVDSRVGADNKQGVGVNWKWDY